MDGTNLGRKSEIEENGDHAHCRANAKGANANVDTKLLSISPSFYEQPFATIFFPKKFTKPNCD